MPALVDLKKENVVKVAVKMVNDNGWDSLNARSLAKNLGISTKPLYRVYKSMDEIKEDTYKEIYRQYDVFINSRIDSKKALLTLAIAYVEFAQNYRNLFKSLFLSNNLKWEKFEDVLDEKWNQSTIINLVNKHGFSFDEAKSLFLNFWLYANGLATLIATNEIEVDGKEILVKLVKMYKLLTKNNDE
ncbi:MAG: TetR/AcrR family transcriptional regulator [Firmicutes bacterium]|nr:TetR/AcrR family transcriptional regulator [Bacillota bacterium]